MATRVEETVPGRAGGQATAKKYGPRYMSRIGRKGGKAVLNRYGVEFFSLIGTLGSDAVNEHLSKTRRTNVIRSIRRLVNNG